ncbi:MAG: aminotransferase class III-fold pyridoxal phosphate-dependent enzyme [Gemmatimonadota bacterium]
MIPTGSPLAPDSGALSAFLSRVYGLEGDLLPLSGERDWNFLLHTPGGIRYVVKVSSPWEPAEALEGEVALLDWLGRHTALPLPGVVPTGEGALLGLLPAASGETYAIRVLSYLPGVPLAEVRPRTPVLLRKVGAAAGQLVSALEAYPGEAPAREAFEWALDQAGPVMERTLSVLGDEDPSRPLIQEALGAWPEAHSRAASLPLQVIHGDLNDHNILLSPSASLPREVTGILDFGDSHAAPAVFDHAIALAYGTLGCPDPLEAAQAMVQGFHAERELSEDEVALLFPLWKARLGQSLGISAARRASAGNRNLDPYLLISEAPARDALTLLLDIPDALAEGTLRLACGLHPCRRAASFHAWLATQDPTPVVELPEDPSHLLVLDLSVGSPLLDGRDTEDTEAFSLRISRALGRAGAAVGIGRYGEPRAFYLTDAFAGRPSEMPERRTVHLGVDLFVPPGTPVRAPLDARVCAAADNARRLDYGPTVILEHDAPFGPFWTLYGHLSRESLNTVSPGDEVRAGQEIGRVGAYPENGDWPPHLHVQILLNRMGFERDFPGVAAPRERKVWMSFCPDPGRVAGLSADIAYHEMPAADLLKRRRAVLGPSLSLAYRSPIHVVRGSGAFLYDDMGRAYLDGVNNVAHVGHEHPRVVEAGRLQMGVLNTNTRYLHEAVVDYAEALLDTFPAPLSVCFFVNSGSEANELALRMARTYTGGRGVVALEGGYHGNTQALIEVSHYKFAGPGGQGAPPWVAAIPMPDEFRGRYRAEDAERAPRYAGHVSEAFRELAARGHAPAAFLAESILSCGGQIVPPEGFFPAAYTFAREVGAVCIADEVQIGFGRVGSHMWGFQIHGVVPDIVTLGKPMGNGHPVGAVVTTRDIADAFNNGMEFFSTYGGNPVSAAIGSAVLDVLREEGLQQHALETGRAFLEGLRRLARRHPVMADVRGRGMFLGVEFTTGGAKGAPSAEIAGYVVERLKQAGILLSTDGPDRNVIKIKPPLPFSRRDVERVLGEMDRVLAEDPVRALSGGAGAD